MILLQNETISDDTQDELLVQDGDLMMIAFLSQQATDRIKHENVMSYPLS